MERYANRTAVVTGASSGIGRACARRLHREGARVLLLGRREEALRETAAGLDRASVLKVDLRIEEQVTDTARKITAAHDRIDLLVNAAGVIKRDVATHRTSDALWNELLAINFLGPERLTRALIDGLMRSEEAAIVNVASIYGRIVHPGVGAYATIKGALEAWTRALAVDLAPQVRVNAVSPGLVHTPLAYVDRPDFGEHAEEFARAHPMQRIGRPEDIAAAVAFLGSIDASWITGETLVVDGGFTLQ